MEATALSIGIGKSALSGALGYAKSAVAEEVALQLGVVRDQAFIKDELEMMLSFLMAAHEVGDKHQVNETWVKQVRIVASDVEDSLMDFAVRVQKQSWWPPWRIPRTLRDRRHVAKQMKGLRTKVEDVSQRNMRYRPIIMGSTSSKTATAAGDGAAAVAAAMFDINEARYAAKQKPSTRLDLTQMINIEGEDLGVIAVWGTSSNVGHVSIIWEAYESSDVQKNFPCRAWVRVMHPLKPEELIQSLLEEFRTVVGADYLLQAKKTGEELVEEFNRYVNSKRCLIVLNDLSTIEEWNRVKKCFPINKNGNRVIVSTTDVEVASLCVGQNSSVSELKQLSADQTIYAFYKEPITGPSFQMSTMTDSLQRAGDEDGNNHTKNSQDATYSAESVSSSLLLPTSEIQEDQSKDSDGKIQEGHTRTSMTTGVVEEPQLVGRETEKEHIVNLILEHAHEYFAVIAVWGTGGIGKTTLVTDVYQKQELNERFTKRAFVTVLRPFKLQELLKSIAIQLGANSSEKKGAIDFACDKENDYASMSIDRLTKALDRLSQDRKCLLVVDNLLYTTEWDTIIESFREIKKARSWTIVVTTRQKDIAEHCCHQKSGCTHMLNLLKEEEARKLFIQKVFKRMVDLDKEYPDLVGPTKLILNKCDGLPLAIVTIGGFLAEQETKSAVEWKKLNDHINAELEANPNIEHIRAVLMKSYDGLPYYLKPCFLYMSIFPEDCNISRRRLVRRWAAEGYSAVGRDKSSMETADGYFEELIERSMILSTHENTFSRQNADSCKLHDLIRDISISMSMKENLVFRLEEGCSSNSHSTVRHLVISSNWEGDESELQSIVEVSRIRSLTVFGKFKPFYISDKMRFLRVLDLEGTYDLPNHCLDQIGKLLHLRYLSLRGCYGIFRLPDSVGNLSELEVLDIKMTRIQMLPKTIVRLRKLSHLHAAALPPNMMGMRFPGDYGAMVPKGMKKVKSLHTLRYVHLAWRNAVVEEIKGLTGLRKLGVVGINEKNSKNLCSAISKLRHLESMSLLSSGLDLSHCLNGMDPPPENLQSLKLCGSKMARLPEWIQGLQNLEKLTLERTGLSRDGAAMLMQDIGRLPNLSILRLDEQWLDDIAIGELQFRSGLFTRLKVLELCYNGLRIKIDSVTFDDGAMPKLEVLHLWLLGQSDVRFSGLEYLRSIKQVRLRYDLCYDKSRYSVQIREQLDKIKRGHVLMVESDD